ncbi:hypothetical protein IPJ72_00150 [Candidatus Peregrinibacteria bacterium]|nr:MAG: hypothetical protein IPJ72_00150 [Candidatus Peregrinibacteria bacterium]
MKNTKSFNIALLLILIVTVVGSVIYFTRIKKECPDTLIHNESISYGISPSSYWVKNGVEMEVDQNYYEWILINCEYDKKTTF